ncbi:MAG TPA: M50 family metallopeptidase [Prosthecobacter sp.]
MLRFSFFGIPVSIHWMFWATLALLGGIIPALENLERLNFVLVWVAAGALSIFVHELGHALVMHHYGARHVQIVLQSFGGYAVSERRFARGEQFFVSAAGPFVQIAAGVLVWWVKDAWQPAEPLGRYFMGSFVNVSLFWAVLNLFPIIPLDGGRIMETILGPAREKTALVVSLVCAVLFAVAAFAMGQLFIAIFFLLFAGTNWRQLQGEPPQMR